MPTPEGSSVAESEWERVQVRRVEIIEEVRLSRAWRAAGSVAAGRAVAWWGFILGRGKLRREGVGVVVFSVLGFSGFWAVEVESVGVVSDVEDNFGMVVPVIADQISSTGGFGSDQGTVKRGLSHLLIVVGSS